MVPIIFSILQTVRMYSIIHSHLNFQRSSKSIVKPEHTRAFLTITIFIVSNLPGLQSSMAFLHGMSSIK